jgi:hypothetical protein
VAQPKPIPATDPVAQAGPYEAVVNGTCAQGHPVNGMGRCQPLNDGAERQFTPVSAHSPSMAVFEGLGFTN